MRISFFYTQVPLITSMCQRIADRLIAGKLYKGKIIFITLGFGEQKETYKLIAGKLYKGKTIFITLGFGEQKENYRLVADKLHKSKTIFITLMEH